MLFSWNGCLWGLIFMEKEIMWVWHRMHWCLIVCLESILVVVNFACKIVFNASCLITFNWWASQYPFSYFSSEFQYYHIITLLLISIFQNVLIDLIENVCRKDVRMDNNCMKLEEEEKQKIFFSNSIGLSLISSFLDVHAVNNQGYRSSSIEGIFRFLYSLSCKNYSFRNYPMHYKIT